MQSKSKRVTPFFCCASGEAPKWASRFFCLKGGMQKAQQIPEKTKKEGISI